MCFMWTLCYTEEALASPQVNSVDDKDDDDKGDDLLRRLKIASEVQMSIFNKRNQYSSINREIRRPVWKGMEGMFTETGEIVPKAVTFVDGSEGNDGDKAATGAEGRATPSRQSTDSGARSGSGQAPRSGGRRGRDGSSGGDFMKDLLVGNARRRYKKSNVPSLESRITDFFSRMPVDDTGGIHELSADEKKRQWLLLTKGSKALVKVVEEEGGNEEGTANGEGSDT